MPARAWFGACPQARPLSVTIANGATRTSGTITLELVGSGLASGTY